MRTNRIVFMGQTVLATLATIAASAQEVPTTAAGISEVIVSAQKRDQSIQDVPISITAFNGEALEKNMISGLSDYFAQTPNVNYSANGNDGRYQIAIRGVPNTLGGRANSIGVYVDEFNIAPTSSIRTYNPKLIDVERVEVLRGPQGTYFGRNSTGGAMSIVTRKPGKTFAADGSLEVGRYGSRLYRAGVDVPIADWLAVRTTGYYEESDGFITNIGPSGGSSDVEAHGQRVAFRLTPSNALVIDLAASNSDYHHGPNAVVLRDPVTLGVPDSPWTTNVNATEFTKNAGQIYTGRIQYDFGSVALVGITGYIDNHYQEFSDDDATAAATAVADSNTQLRSFSQEVRLQSAAETALEWLFGFIYAKDAQSIGSVTSRDPAIGGGTLRTTLQDEQTKMYAAYADATWHATKRLSFTFGGRYTQSFYDRFDINTTGAVVTQPGLREQDDKDFSPRFVVSQKWNPGLTTYASVAKGFKAGAASGVIPAGANPLFGKETLWNYEVGAKAAWLDGRMRMNAALFYMDWTDLQVIATIDRTQLLFFVQNAAKASNKGVELELAAQPLEGLELGANIGYLDAKFDDFPNARSNNALVDLSGYSIPFAPDWTLSANAQYSMPLGAWRGFIRTEWSRVATFFRDPDAEFRLQNNGVRTFVIPSRNVWNVRLGVDNERFSIAAYMENAFEEEYYTGVRGSTLVDPHPRQYGVRLAARFN